jgi:hypothetical protein
MIECICQAEGPERVEPPKPGVRAGNSGIGARPSLIGRDYLANRIAAQEIRRSTHQGKLEGFLRRLESSERAKAPRARWR